ncbi:MAG: tRNA (adenosine(37)-N6)-threonylcarbamoyltransferase complex ATPase subunit type 1 TsaE [Candidatus Omnitrophota bacterium]
MKNVKTITTYSPEETIEIAASLAKKLNKGSFVALIGDLGTGKTMFVKGLAKGLGIAEYSYVNSPSFVIVKEYKGEKDLYHFDVYRLGGQSFCDTLDYEKYFYGRGITVVEWADKVRDILPEEYLEVRIEYGDDSERKFYFKAFGEKFEEVIEELNSR